MPWPTSLSTPAAGGRAAIRRLMTWWAVSCGNFCPDQRRGAGDNRRRKRGACRRDELLLPILLGVDQTRIPRGKRHDIGARGGDAHPRPGNTKSGNGFPAALTAPTVRT